MLFILEISYVRINCTKWLTMNNYLRTVNGKKNIGDLPTEYLIEHVVTAFAWIIT